jgi:hypothetical protein
LPWKRFAVTMWIWTGVQSSARDRLPNSPMRGRVLPSGEARTVGT